MGKTQTAPFTFDRKMVAKIIAAVAAILCFVGLFGTIMTHSITESGVGEVARREFTLSYFFKDAWDGIKLLGLENAGTLKFALVLQIISFFVGAGGFLFALGYIGYCHYKKEDIKFNFLLTILLVTSVQYLFMSRFTCYYNGFAEHYSYGPDSEDRKNIYAMGWGGILITIGFFLGLASSVVYDYDSKYDVINKKSICKRIALIAIFFIGLFGLANTISLGSEYSISEIKYSYTNNFNVFMWITYINQPDVIENVTTVKALSIIALIFGIVSYISLSGAAVHFIKEGDSKLEKKLPLITSIAFTATSLISNVLLVVAGYLSTPSGKTNADIDNTTVTNPGFTAIVSIILGIGLIVLAIVANKEKKYSKAK